MLLKILIYLIKAKVGYRSKTIINAASFIIKERDTIENLCNLPEEDIEDTLTRIKGVGPYTARLTIAYTCRKYRLPPIDRWLKKILSFAYNIEEDLASKELIKR